VIEKDAKTKGLTADVILTKEKLTMPGNVFGLRINESI
jgi:hypothetical protein